MSIFVISQEYFISIIFCRFVSFTDNVYPTSTTITYYKFNIIYHEIDCEILKFNNQINYKNKLFCACMFLSGSYDIIFIAYRQ